MDEDRLTRLSQHIGPERLVLDLSCRRRGDDYFIVTNRWQTFTQERITSRLLDRLAPHRMLVRTIESQWWAGNSGPANASTSISMAAPIASKPKRARRRKSFRQWN